MAGTDTRTGNRVRANHGGYRPPLGSEELLGDPAHVFCLHRHQAIRKTERRSPISEVGGGSGQLKGQAQVRCQTPDLTCLELVSNSL